MKTYIKYKIQLLPILFIALLMFNSCSKYEEVGKADYPGQVIYMPTAGNGVYNTSNVPDVYDIPTTGAPSRFYVDDANGKLIIPLGVYRGGISYGGTLPVDISSNEAIVTELITEGELTDVELLPSGTYTLPSSVEVLDGKEFVTFNLSIDLAFIKANDDTRFAVGVEIGSSKVEVNPALKSTVVLFDTSVLTPPLDL